MDDKLPLHRLQHRCRQIGESLPLGHHPQFSGGDDAEQYENVAAEIAVLPGVVDLHGEFRPRARRQYDRRELDRLGAGAEHDGDARWIGGRHVAVATGKRVQDLGGSMPMAWRAHARHARSRAP